MKLGLLTAALATWSFDEVATWAAANGFQALEVACWPASEDAARRYAGVCHLDVERLDVAAVHATLRRTGLELSALAYYPNNLHPDRGERAAANAHLRAVIDAAAALGVGTVTTFAGNDRHRGVAENLATFAQVWPALVEHAEGRGVRIAIENCPMLFSADEWPGGDNLARSPAIWRAMFERIPSPALGLNLDPSHLLWQMIDAERAVYEFGDRIFHAHAKDLEIRADGLYEHGVLSGGMGWQVPRLCGHGQVDWGRFVAALYGVGYDATIAVEHEDRRFEGTPELVRRGFRIARDTLAPLLARPE
jgi:sugar phosphate isomerase/epimerase